MYSQAITQSCIVFVFLTLFFFNYVATIEKEEYQNQLERMVDDLFKELKLKPIDDPEKKRFVKFVLYGLIQTSEDEIYEKTIGMTRNIDRLNEGIIKQSYSLMGIYIVLSIVFLFMLYKFGECFSLTENLKEGIFILFFIFIVEFSFLNLIAKNYIAGNLNNVKAEIADTIIKYCAVRRY